MKPKRYVYRLIQRLFASVLYNLILTTKRSSELLIRTESPSISSGLIVLGEFVKHCIQTAWRTVDVQTVLCVLSLLALVSTFILWCSVRHLYGVEQDGVKYSLSFWMTKLRRSIDLASDPNQRVSISSRDLRTGKATELCTENDFAGSDGNVTLFMNWTAIYHVEEEILRTLTNSIKQHLKEDNERFRSVYYRANYEGSSLMKQPHMSVRDVLSEGLILYDGYYYVSGGHWIPAKCHPRWKVAIVVPFRDRFYQLPIFLRNLVPFLKRQNLEFGIYVIEQANNLDFNRAMLMNVGYQQALRFNQWDCFIFHDVDHLPLNDANYYGCSHMPRHFVSGADRWHYRLQYGFFFGAVTGFTRSQIQKFNGFPNVYWGWGGEDDDILIRIKSQGFFKTRPWGVTGFYNVIAEHHKSAARNKKRVCLLDFARERLSTDGLSNLVYPPVDVTLNTLYTNVSVNIARLPWNSDWTVCTPDYKRVKKDHKPK